MSTWGFVLLGQLRAWCPSRWALLIVLGLLVGPYLAVRGVAGQTVAALLMVIALSGTVASVERSDEVAAKLRELAEVAGCEKDDIRVALRWRGQGRPLEVQVWCTEKEDRP